MKDASCIVPLAADTVETAPDVELLEILGHNYFTDRDTLGLYDGPLHSYGAVGDPVPYTVRSDNMITLLLIVSFVIFIASLSRSLHFIGRQLKNFFFVPYNNAGVEMGGELPFLVFLSLVDCLLLAIEAYLFFTVGGDYRFHVDSDLVVIAVLFAAFATFFMLKGILYSFVDLVFFDGKRNVQILQALLLLTALEGVVLFPLVLLQVYLDLSIEKSVYYFVFVLILNKILTFYKSWVIFFRQKGFFVQIFLYFCALEIAPLLALCGVGMMAMDFLKVNY